MGLESVKRWLERGDGDSENTPIPLPPRLIDSLVAQGIKFDLVEPGRVVCSMKVPPRLVNSRNLLHGGATASLIDFVGAAVIFSAGAVNNGVSLEINVSYLDNALANEEIEIESKALRIGRTIGVVGVELRKKKTRKIVAQGRHTKYLSISSKM